MPDSGIGCVTGNAERVTASTRQKWRIQDIESEMSAFWRLEQVMDSKYKTPGLITITERCKAPRTMKLRTLWDLKETVGLQIVVVRMPLCNPYPFPCNDRNTGESAAETLYNAEGAIIDRATPKNEEEENVTITPGLNSGFLSLSSKTAPIASYGEKYYITGSPSSNNNLPNKPEESHSCKEKGKDESVTREILLA